MRFTRQAAEWVNFRFNNQVVLEKIGEKPYYGNSKVNGKTYRYEYIQDLLRVKCDCGRERDVSAKSLLMNNSLGCRYCSTKKENHIGERCGSLLVEAKLWKVTKFGRSVIWLVCKCCDCNNIHEVKADIFRQSNTSCPNCRKSSKFTPSFTKNRSPKKYFSNIKNGAISRNYGFSITLEQILELLENQSFKCNLSKVDLSIEDGSASLDRIDNMRGYTIDNIQWVHRTINYMKNELSQFEFVRFCKLVASNSYE